VRLFCFPFAGGGASFYRPWKQHLPAAIDACPVQLPGREERIAEPAYRRVSNLVQALRSDLTAVFDRPYAFFGHSMGALIAFELARALRAPSFREPQHIFVSAHRAPTIPARRRYHELDDTALVAVLRRIGGSADAALDHDELMALLLPTVRADFELCETYRYVAGAPLDVPITVFGGREDSEVAVDDLHGWRSESSAHVSIRVIEGSHFFLNEAQAQVLSSITAVLAAPPGARASDVSA